MSAGSPKNHLRARIRTQRSALSSEERSRRGAAISQNLSARIGAHMMVAGYLALLQEPDIGGFLDAHVHRGGGIYLPVIASAAQRHLRWAPWTPETELRRNAMLPVMEPVTPSLGLAQMLSDLEGPSQPGVVRPNLVMIVPSLGISASGARLGQGGGFYDTTAAHISDLAAEASVQLIGVCYSEELLSADTFQPQPHDLQVSEIITDKGHHRVEA